MIAKFKNQAKFYLAMNVIKNYFVDFEYKKFNISETDLTISTDNDVFAKYLIVSLCEAEIYSHSLFTGKADYEQIE